LVIDPEVYEPAVRGDQGQVLPPETTIPVPQTTIPTVSYAHGECGWVQDKLVSRGVRPPVVVFLVAIALRESACCPHVRGGDVVDADCNFLYVSRNDHRSDTGTFQLNGVHWKTAKGFICPAFTCSQEVLLYDIEMQFDAMLILYTMCGAKPWTAPNYGCSPANPY
jgi:hypothetical protein